MSHSTKPVDRGQRTKEHVHMRSAMSYGNSARWAIVTDERISRVAPGALSFRTAPTGALKELLNAAPAASVIFARPWVGAETHTVRVPSTIEIVPLPDWTGLGVIAATPQLARTLSGVAKSMFDCLIVFGPGVTSLMASLTLTIARRMDRDNRAILLVRGSFRDALPPKAPALIRPAVHLLARGLQRGHARLQRTAFPTRAFVSRALAEQWMDPQAPVCPEVDWQALNRLGAPGVGDPPRDCILFLGRLSREKGADLAVEAYLEARPADYHLIVAGDGPERQRLEREVSESQSPSAKSVEFIGTVEHDLALRLLQRAIITLVPSRAEAFGLVALEALVAGSQVLHSGQGGLPEATAGHPAAMVVSNADVTSWASAISAALADPTASRSALAPDVIGTSPGSIRDQRGWASLLDLVERVT